MKTFAYKAACSFFGAGYLPRFPGTWASLAGAGLYLAALGLDLDMWRLLPACALVSGAAGVALGRKAKDAFGKKDPPQFVLDEICGFCISLVFLWRYDLLAGAAAFGAFRLFDIAKPWPIRNLEKLPSGWGIMFDDVLAGIFANVVVRAAQAAAGI